MTENRTFVACLAIFCGALVSVALICAPARMDEKRIRALENDVEQLKRDIRQLEERKAEKPRMWTCIPCERLRRELACRFLEAT